MATTNSGLNIRIVDTHVMSLKISSRRLIKMGQRLLIVHQGIDLPYLGVDQCRLENQDSEGVGKTPFHPLLLLVQGDLSQSHCSLCHVNSIPAAFNVFQGFHSSFSNPVISDSWPIAKITVSQSIIVALYSSLN